MPSSCKDIILAQEKQPSVCRFHNLEAYQQGKAHQFKNI